MHKTKFKNKVDQRKKNTEFKKNGKSKKQTKFSKRYDGKASFRTPDHRGSTFQEPDTAWHHHRLCVMSTFFFVNIYTLQIDFSIEKLIRIP